MIRRSRHFPYKRIVTTESHKKVRRRVRQLTERLRQLIRGTYCIQILNRQSTLVTDLHPDFVSYALNLREDRVALAAFQQDSRVMTI